MGKKNLLNQQSFEEYYKTIPKEKSDTISYNLRDAYNAYPDSIMQKFKNDKYFHLPDTYKTTQHITHSQGSIYSPEKGGK